MALVHRGVGGWHEPSHELSGRGRRDRLTRKEGSSWGAGAELREGDRSPASEGVPHIGESCCARDSPLEKASNGAWHEETTLDHSTTAPCISPLHPDPKEPGTEAGGSSPNLGGQWPRLDRAGPRSYTSGHTCPDADRSPGPPPGMGKDTVPSSCLLQKRGPGQKGGARRWSPSGRRKEAPS